MKKVMYLILPFLVIACGGEEKEGKEKSKKKQEQQEEVKIMPATEMLTAEDIKSVFTVPEGTTVELNDVSDSFGEIIEYKFQNVYPADSTKEADTADVKVVLDYMYPGKAKYKTHEEAVAFLEKKFETNPDDYKKIEFPFPAARTTTLYNLSFVYKNVIINITSPFFRYTEDEKFEKAKALGEIIAKKLK